MGEYTSAGYELGSCVVVVKSTDLRTEALTFWSRGDDGTAPKLLVSIPSDELDGLAQLIRRVRRRQDSWRCHLSERLLERLRDLKDKSPFPKTNPKTGEEA